MAVPASRTPDPWEEEELPPQRTVLQRSLEQEQARIERAKMMRQGGSSKNLRNTANDNSVVANDNEGESEVSQDQERVNRARFIRAQTILASQEEAYNQIHQSQGESPSLLHYIPAFSVAFFKDALDLILIGSLPVLGTIITFFASVLIFIFLLFTKKNGGFSDMRTVVRRFLIILVGFIIEGFVFGVNFFPFEIATVAIIYFMDKHLSEKQIAVLKSLAQGLGK